MVEKHKVPAVVVGGQEKGDAIPIDQAWFDRIIELQKAARELPQLKGRALSLPVLMHCELEGIEPSKYELFERPGNEPDRRALVHLIPPEGAKVAYSGSYKIEKEDGNKIVAKYPRIDEVVGVEFIAGRPRGEILIIMHPGSSVRVVQTVLNDAHVFRYKLSGWGEPKIIDTSPPDQGIDSRVA
jgi:hypothetical protein